MFATSAQAPALQPAISREPELKGRMVGLLGKLVKWPSAAAPTEGKPLTIGILGSDPFVEGNGFNHLQANAPQAIIQQYERAEAIGDCHILVVAADADLQAALAEVETRPVLVVGESLGQAQQGAAINLVFDRQQNKIRLEIKPAAAVRVGLQINRGLLSSSMVDIIR